MANKRFKEIPTAEELIKIINKNRECHINEVILPTLENFSEKVLNEINETFCELKHFNHYFWVKIPVELFEKGIKPYEVVQVFLNKLNDMGYEYIIEEDSESWNYHYLKIFMGKEKDMIKSGDKKDNEVLQDEELISSIEL